MLSHFLKPDRSRFHHAVLALVLAHLLAVMALAALPKVHALVHDHAHSDSHDHGHPHEHVCAVTEFLQGNYTTSVAAIIVTGVTVWSAITFLRPRLVWVENLFLAGSLLEHAPPRR